MYVVRDDPPDSVRADLESYDSLTRRLLHARGITDSSEARRFFSRDWDPPDPYRYSAMRDAARRVLRAISDRETIGIYSDYDCDGIPAAAALHSTLRAFGHEALVYRVPDRNTEGFGLSRDGVAALLDSGVSVACVLDCGTSDPDRVDEMRRAGVDVIIVDHHLPGAVSPSPFALINPATEAGIDEPYPCAAGVLYLFIQAILDQAPEFSLAERPSPGWEKWQLDTVALATISDMVPLRGLNRQLVHYGLQVIRKSPRPGIRALCRAVGVSQQDVTQDDLSFLMIPRINAASRMGDARIAFDLLTAESADVAAKHAAALTDLNTKRKGAVSAMARAALSRAETKDPGKTVWVFGDRRWKPSLAGLLAQKISEAHGKTVFVWGQGGGDSGFIKGSCRSACHDVFGMMEEASDAFEESGGHARAGGFTLRPGHEVTLEDRLNDTAASREPLSESLHVDAECPARDVPGILNLCGQFAPFGMQNERPLIAIPGCRISSRIRFGKKKEHVRYVFSDHSGSVDGIRFFSDAPDDEGLDGSERAVVGFPEYDSFRRGPRVRVLKIL